MQLTREHLNRDRPPGPIAQQPVDDLRRAALLIARVPQPGQLARAPLEIRGGHVVEHQFPSLEMPAGETILDPLLALKQPVHRRVQIVLIGVRHPQLIRQRRLRERPDRRELRRRRDRPLADHRHHQIPLPARRAVHQPGQLQPPRHRKRRDHVPGGQRALDLEGVTEQADRLAAQPRPHQLDQLLGQMGDVPDRLVADLPALPIRAPQQVGDVLPTLALPPIGDNVDRTCRTWLSRHD